ncbi:glycosyl hydrolase family 2 [Chryseobacterium artocarpi]|uniref:Glycosyl hydrolase family 2 n=1 Tax=Chryseobacterium artocarpi TaxID=1414727 RepID=A0A1B8ZC51_9FLAO|nr:glycosyl hydrolase [Chryseobacterium artocarpi]OCA69087.1 glycosyl hydrolase family 2 [Chryseobacterium artocarpi]
MSCLKKNTFLIFLLSIFSLYKGQLPHSLETAKIGFLKPQDTTRTKVWWFHGETETTKEGITADLAAFKKAGIGGVVYYDQSHGKAEKALDGFSVDWWKMLKFAAVEAKRIGLSFELHISNGYVAGGPWITNESGMKRLTATEKVIKGGSNFQGKLPEPKNKFDYFKDVAVIAFPAPDGAGKTSFSEEVVISSDIKSENVLKLFERDANTVLKIPRTDKGHYINLYFPNGFEARSISYKMQPRGKATSSATNVPAPPSATFTGTGYRVLPDFGQLEVSYDGVNYHKICDLKPIYKAHESWRQKTLSFKTVKAKYYRLNLNHWWEDSESNQELQLNSIVLHSMAMIDQYEEKAGLFSEYIEPDKTPKFGKNEVIQSNQVINVTDKVDADGILNWNVPEGEWVVMRFAYEPTGANTKHGRKNLLGRECDKLSVEAANLQWDKYVGVIVDSLKISGIDNLLGIAMDSHEAGAQNWTESFPNEFKVRQGYDMKGFLPAMMGYIVDSPKTSDGFLFDVRRNIADMIADNYYGTFNKLAKSNGLHFTAQAIGNALCIVGDPIMAKGKVDKPQGEFWVIHPDGNYDIKESSSAAHIYGKPIASAEAFTDAKYSTTLHELKSLANYAYAFGINEFVICASAYQPWLDKIPGSTGGGRQYAINRNNTWWDFSAPFWDFQARSTYLMRMGKSVADICIYLGDNAPVKILTNRLPDIPGGFDFDAFSTDALINRLSGAKGKIMLPDGNSYKIMVLPKSQSLTYSALKKIAQIVEKGGRIYGAKPEFSGSTADIVLDKEYRKLADRLWGKNPPSKGTRKYGLGTVYWGGTLQSVLELAQVFPDLELEKSDCKTSKIYFNHRSLKDADMYFIDNHKEIEEDNVFRFSAKGKYVQVWDPSTGMRYNAKSKIGENGNISVPLTISAKESLFVMISNNFEELPIYNEEFIAPRQILKLNNSWDVYFDKGKGGIGNINFKELKDWTNFNDPQIKYYSGTAIYKNSFHINSLFRKAYIRLGIPGSVAQVLINGQDAGTVWCSPWKLDISKFLNIGQNSIEIKVANSLINRMIYDSTLPHADRVTFSYPEISVSNGDLQQSGLTEVQIISYEL